MARRWNCQMDTLSEQWEFTALAARLTDSQTCSRRPSWSSTKPRNILLRLGCSFWMSSEKVILQKLLQDPRVSMLQSGWSSLRQQQAECPGITTTLSNQACLMRRVIGALLPRTRRSIQRRDWLWQTHNGEPVSGPACSTSDHQTPASMHTPLVYMLTNACIYTRTYAYMKMTCVNWSFMSTQ